MFSLDKDLHGCRQTGSSGSTDSLARKDRDEAQSATSRPHSDWKHDNLTEWAPSDSVRNIFDIFFLPQVPFIDRGQNFARIYGTTSLKRRAVECRQCSVPVDSLNVPKSTSRRFRHFKHLLRSLFEVEKKKDSLRESNKCVLYGFYTNNVLVRP